jgi:hypothetical protein
MSANLCSSAEVMGVLRGYNWKLYSSLQLEVEGRCAGMILYEGTQARHTDGVQKNIKNA